MIIAGLVHSLLKAIHEWTGCGRTVPTYLPPLAELVGPHQADSGVITIRTRCPICEELHEWQVPAGCLGTALSADHHPADTRLTKAQKAVARRLIGNSDGCGRIGQVTATHS